MIDFGQALTLTANPVGGTPPYSYQWYWGGASSCSDDPPVDGATAATFIVTPEASTYVCYTVMDSLAANATSSTDFVEVNADLEAAAPTPFAPTFDSGQEMTLATEVYQGTPPYAYQWYASNSLYCGANSSAIPGATGGVYATPAALVGTTTYCYVVTDSAVGAPAASSVSGADPVTVNPALVAGAVTPSSPAIDVGQSITLTANVVGGTPEYAYQWYAGESAVCTADAPIDGATAPTLLASPATSTYYCYGVTDSSTNPPTIRSTSDYVSVNAPLSAGPMTPAYATLDLGQSLILTVHPSGGTPPYSYQWRMGPSEGCSDDALIPGIYAPSYVVNPSATTYYCYEVTDSASGPSTVLSATGLVIVNPALVAGPVTPAVPVISLGGSVTLTANPTGGTPPYSYQWFTGASNNCTDDTPVAGATASTLVVVPTSNTYYCYAVTDVSTPPPSVTSQTDLVAVGPAVSTVTVGSAPVAVAYDPVNGRLYEANSGSNSVGVLDASGDLIATVPVGTEPIALAVNSTNGNVYVANFGSNSVTVINGASDTVAATIPVGTNPYALAYDGYNELVYVADYGSGNVNVIDATSASVTATVTIGPEPTALAVDSANGEVYVLNGTNPFIPPAPSGENDNATVLSGGSSVAMVPVGRNPVALTYDASNGQFYVSNFGSGNVSVIWGANNTVNTSVTIASPEAIAYNGVNHDVYVVGVGPGSTSDLYRIDSVTNEVVAVIPLDPVALAASPISGNIYAVNSAANSVSVVSGSTNSVIATVAVGSGPTSVAVNTATGAVFVTDEESGSVSEIPAKIPTFYPVIFEETGLPSGAMWSINLGGSVLSTTGTTVTYSEENGTYAFTVGAPTGYVGPSGSGSVDVSGALVIETVTFTVHSCSPTTCKAAYQVEFTESGLPVGTKWTLDVPGEGSFSSVTDAIVFTAANGEYTYALSSSTPGFAAPGGSFTVNGTPVSVAVVFSPTSTVTYAVTFTESGLPSGTEWYVNITGEPSLSSSGTTITALLPDGSYSYTVASGNRSFTGAGGGFTVNSAVVSISIEFSPPASVTVTFVESGLPANVLARDGWSASIGRVQRSPVGTQMVDGATVHTKSSSVILTLLEGTYVVLFTATAGYVTHANRTLNISGPASYDVVFTKGATVTLTVEERGLPHGQTWCVDLNGATLCSGRSAVKYPDLTPSSYLFAVNSPFQGQTVSMTVNGVPAPTFGTVLITSNAKIQVTFLYDYPVRFTETGLSSGSWSVTVKGFLPQSNTSGGPIVFLLPNGTYTYKVGSVNGYKAVGTPRKVVVDGAPGSVSVVFTPDPSADRAAGVPFGLAFGTIALPLAAASTRARRPPTRRPPSAPPT